MSAMLGEEREELRRLIIETEKELSESQRIKGYSYLDPKSENDYDLVYYQRQKHYLWEEYIAAAQPRERRFLAKEKK
jgi:hypothetical protein